MEATRDPFAITDIVHTEPFGLGTDVGGYRISFDNMRIAEAEMPQMFRIAESSQSSR